MTPGYDARRFERSFEKIDNMSSSQEFIPVSASKSSSDTKNNDNSKDEMMESINENKKIRYETYMEKLKNIG